MALKTRSERIKSSGRTDALTSFLIMIQHFSCQRRMKLAILEFVYICRLHHRPAEDIFEPVLRVGYLAFDVGGHSGEIDGYENARGYFIDRFGLKPVTYV